MNITNVLLDAGTTALVVVLVIIGVILIAALWILFWYIGVMNRFRRTRVKVDESLSGIDVALTKRYDLLTKLLASTKGYAKHEYETLSKVIGMRAGVKKGVTSAKDLSLGEKSDLAGRLDQVAKSIDVVVEKYPDLKADQTFLKLMSQTEEVEERLQAARRIYNSNVSMFNQRRVTFPSSIVANKIGFIKDLEFFNAEDKKREDVKFDF
jgi:LemA protein